MPPLSFAIPAACLLLLSPLCGQQTDPPTLRGRVVDMFGAPVVGAEIVHDDETLALDLRATAMSDEDGVFELRGVPHRDSWKIVAHHPGMADGITDHLHELRAVRLVMLESVVVHGVLRDRRNRPVANTLVRGLTFLRQIHEQLVTTDEEGRFALDRLPAGPTSIVAHVEGEGLYMQNRYVYESSEAHLSPSGGECCEAKLRFLGLTAAQRADLVVHLAPNGGYPGLPPSWDGVPLDADSSCQLSELPAVRYEVRLRSRSGRFGTVARDWDPRSETNSPTFSISEEELRPVSVAARLGRAADDAKLPKLGPDWIFATPAAASGLIPDLGHPASGVARPAITDKLSLRGRILGPARQPAPGIAVELRPVAWDTLLGEPVAATVTDEHGAYTFEELDPLGHPVVVVAGPDGGWAQGQPVDLDCSSPLLEIEPLQLMQPGRVFGVVRDSESRPAAGIRVRLMSMPDGHGSTITDEVVTNQSGEFCFLDVAPGRGRLHAFAEEGPSSGDAGRLFQVPSGRTVMRDLVWD